MKAVIGIDFGTQSARAILADAATGETLLHHAAPYPHGILPGDLVDAADYEWALDQLLKAVTQSPYRDSIESICVDATSLTLVPVDAQGRTLGSLPAFADQPQAMVKLWKRHAAQAQADEALALAQRTDQPFLKRTGGSISSEWMLPKLMETYDEAPDVWASMDAAFDLCDFLTYRLTDRLTRSAGSMCFKALWAEDLGFPQEEYLEALRPGLSAKYRHLLRGDVLPPGSRAGFLRAELAEGYGLRQPVTVAVGILDGHTSLAALGALEAGDATLVVGTSNVLAVQTGALREIDGICGIARDGFCPGLYGIDAGQACTGDMLDWYIRSALPASVQEAAPERGVSPHTLLCERIRQPWSDKIAAVDWFNGSRNAPCDLSLPGAWVGLTMESRPEEMYLALLQSIVCGTREIVEQCRLSGVAVSRLLATGGITRKNPLLMQLYADILGQTVWVAQFEEGPALGAAIYAAVAAGLYASVREAHRHMGIQEMTAYTPDMAHRAAYEAVYQKNHRLRQMLIQYKAEGN